MDLPIDDSPKPPAFGCIVYVRKTATGVSARVANLNGLVIESANEREALGKLVPLFREKVAQMTEQGVEIPWIDPPVSKEEDEQRRFLPVHL